MGERVECGECNGTGIAYCPLEYGVDEHPENCPCCGGSNKIICVECDGCGYIDEDTRMPWPDVD